MKIEEHDIAAIKALGYTEDEARFLYIVATHSGYFVPRQFLDLTGASWGYRTDQLSKKLESRGHATWREYQDTGGVYHLFSKKLYAEIGKENLRNRRRHSVEFIRTRLVLLDFVIANQQYDYLETEEQKVGYFCKELALPKTCLPTKTYEGSSSSEPTLRYFVDKYPLFLDSSRALFLPCGHVVVCRPRLPQYRGLFEPPECLSSALPRTERIPVPVDIEFPGPFCRCGEMLLLGGKGTDFNRDCGGCSAVLPSSESVGPEEVRAVLEQRDRVVERCNTPVPRRPLRLSSRGLVLGKTHRR